MSRETLPGGIRTSKQLQQESDSLALDCSPYPTLICNELGAIKYLNHALASVWGFEDANGLIGREVRELWREGEAINGLLQEAMTTGNSAETLEARHSQGTTFFVEAIARRLQARRNESASVALYMTPTTSDVFQLQQELCESKRRLEESHEIAKIGNWELDLLGNVLTWSDQVFDIFEVAREEFGGDYEYFLSLVVPDDRALVNDSFLDSLGKSRSYEVTHRIRTSAGKVKWVNERCKTFIDCNGEPIRCMGTVQDVTAQVETQRALQVANARMRSIIDSHYGFVGLLDLNGGLIEINATPFKSDVVNRHDVLGKALWDTEWFSHCRTTSQQIRSAVLQAQDGQSLRFEIDIRCCLNELRTHDISFEPLLDSEGKIVNVVAYAVDISQRKQAEVLLRESENFTRSTLDALSAEIAVLDEMGIISHVNRAWTEFAASCCTYWHTAPKGTNYLELCRRAGAIGIKSASQLAQGIDDILRGRRSEFTVEHCCQSASGQQWFLSRGTQYPGQERVVIVHADITSVKMAESQMEELRSQLVHASRIATMGEMAAGIAHELNQPLSAIRLYAEGGADGISKGTLNDSAIADMLANIAGLATRCGQVIRGLREFAMREEQTRITIDVRDVIHEVLQFMGHECRCTGVSYSLNLGDEAQLVMANPIQLQQVVVNLIRNAIEAQAGQNRLARIEICARSIEERQVEISVKDNGPGMTPETRSRLFDPFFTTKPSNLGMGLKISQSILRDHGGKIDCTSDAEHGTTFLVRLPLAENVQND
ncbi:PAS domain S-box protein [Blastopirellula sp. JC733]|nr:PAS domain S-box protein [Blastopirellula sediminis]